MPPAAAPAARQLPRPSHPTVSPPPSLRCSMDVHDSISTLLASGSRSNHVPVSSPLPKASVGKQLLLILFASSNALLTYGILACCSTIKSNLCPALYLLHLQGMYVPRNLTSNYYHLRQSCNSFPMYCTIKKDKRFETCHVGV